MIRAVRLVIADAAYAEHLKSALSRSGPWEVERVEDPDGDAQRVLVLDEGAFSQLHHPLTHPERVVLITHQDPKLLARAWEAGIVSVVSSDDSVATVLLAIMAAALRIAKPKAVPASSGISPNSSNLPAPLSPDNQISKSKRCKIR